MERPNYKAYPITDSRTYYKFVKNVKTIDWERYAKNLDVHIDWLQRELAKAKTSEKHYRIADVKELVCEHKEKYIEYGIIRCQKCQEVLGGGC